MTRETQQKLKCILADFFASAAGFMLFSILRYRTLPADTRPDTALDYLLFPQVMAETALVPLMLVGFFALLGSYNREKIFYKSRLDETLKALIGSALAMLMVYFVALINDNNGERATNYEMLLVLLLCLFVPVALERLVLYSQLARRVQRGEYVLDTVIIGASPATANLLARIVRTASNSGLRLRACVDVDGTATADVVCGVPVIRSDDPLAVCRDLDAKAVVILPSEQGIERTAAIIEGLYRLDRPIFVTPDIYVMMGMRPRVSSIVGEPLIDITNANISAASKNCKRLADVAVSAVALIALSPLLALLALIVKLDSPGPIIYRQPRIGYHKKPFLINKFRTMKVDAEPDGPALATEDDPRVTRSGRFMRKYRLDELPQFWNVLKGDMSLVGPRPERDFYARQIIAKAPYYRLIFQVRPGITSWGMVKFGYASDVDQMVERSRFDLLYINNMSISTDIKILLYTIKTVVNGEGK